MAPPDGSRWLSMRGLMMCVVVTFVLAACSAGGDPANTTTSSRDDAAVGRFRELLAAIRSTASRERVFELAGEMEQILASEAVIIPVWSRLNLGAVRADVIAGFVHNPSSASHTWNIESWYRVDR